MVHLSNASRTEDSSSEGHLTSWLEWNVEYLLERRLIAAPLLGLVALLAAAAAAVVPSSSEGSWSAENDVPPPTEGMMAVVVFDNLCAFGTVQRVSRRLRRTASCEKTVSDFAKV